MEAQARPFGFGVLTGQKFGSLEYLLGIAELTVESGHARIVARAYRGDYLVDQQLKRAPAVLCNKAACAVPVFVFDHDPLANIVSPGRMVARRVQFGDNNPRKWMFD